MNLVSVRTATPPAADPQVLASVRAMLVDARDAVREAAVSTNSTGHYDPTTSFWTHRAIWNIGYATGLVQAVAAAQAVTHVPFPLASYTTVLEGARSAVADVADARAGGQVPDLTLFTKYSGRLANLLWQFNYDIAKLDPVPAPAP